MITKDYINAPKSPRLKAVIVEPILLSCINGASFYKLYSILQGTLRSSSPPFYDTLKDYLFHLINYDLIKYDGRKHNYFLLDIGFELLDWIKREKIKSGLYSEDILIIIE